MEKDNNMMLDIIVFLLTISYCTGMYLKGVIYITFVLLKRVNGLSHCLSRIASHTVIMDNIMNQQQD